MRDSRFVVLLLLGIAVLIPLASRTIGQRQDPEKKEDIKKEEIAPPPHTLPSWFRDLDTDGDGQISYAEWREGGRGLIEFRKFDLDDDGIITADEVLQVLKRPLPKGLPSWFKELDTDGDGEITLHQWQEAGRDVDEFRKYDLDNDGILTADEILSYLKKRVEVKLTDGQALYQGATEIATDEKYRGKKAFKILSVKLEEGKTYQFDHISTAFDPYLYLEDSHGDLLAENDDGGEGLNSRIVYRAKRTATYRLIATSLGTARSGGFACSIRVVNRFGKIQPPGLPLWFTDLDKDGDCQISLQEWLAGGRDPAEFHKYDLNGDELITVDEILRYLKQRLELKLRNGQATYKGLILETDELYRGKKSFRMFTLNLEQGKTYQIEHMSPAFHAYLYLEDAEGNVLQENASPEEGQKARLTYHADRTGPYTLIATSGAGVRTGPFELTIRYGGLQAMGLPPWFTDLDKNGDGQISFRKWKESGKDVDEFRQYDRNGDSIITADEVLHTLKKHVELKLNNGQATHRGALVESTALYRGKKSYKMFTIELQEGTTYQLDHISPVFQAFLHIEDSEGNVVQESSSPDIGGNCRLLFHPETTGTYNIIATSLAGYRTGAYVLSIHVGEILGKGVPKWFKEVDKNGEGQITLRKWREAGKDPAEFHHYDLNGDGVITADEVLRHMAKPYELYLKNGEATYKGSVEESDGLYRGKKSYKLFSLRLEQGKTYQIDHISPAFQACLNLEDSEGNMLQEHVATNVGLNSRLLFRADRSGTYRLIATSAAGVRTGPFELKVQFGRMLPEGLPSWFRDLDKNRDGQISRDEWRAARKELGDFHKYDLNDDGFITPEELLRYVTNSAARTLPKGLPSWFKEVDKNGAGQISFRQWQDSGKDPDEFRKYDRNGDSVMTADEVLHTLKKQVHLKLNRGAATYRGTVEESEELYQGKKSYKVFAIDLEQGKTYQFDHVSEAFAPDLYLEDPEGNLLQENSRIVYHADRTGTYRLIATSAAGVRTGPFVLSVHFGQILIEGLPAWFNELDTNGDGQITLEELRSAGKEPTEYQKYDRNGDGVITAEEVLRYLKKPLPNGLPPWFQELDKNGDGKITFEEWSEGGKEPEEFRHWDRNGDGVITVDEALHARKK